MATFLTPKSAEIHFDDLEGLFRLKISFQIVTPVGIFEPIHIEGDLGTLTAVLNALVKWWATVAVDGDDHNIYANLGDLTIAAVADGFQLRQQALLSNPAGFSDEGTLDDPEFTYDGGEDDWGATPPA